MSYEIKYSYCERLENGQYDRENLREMVKKLGNFSEEIPLEKCAAAIMAQLSRRDIFVIGVEVFEYKKSQITFRETKGGIVIKNKKFILDLDSNIKSEDFEEAPQQYPHERIQKPQPQVVPVEPQPAHHQQRSRRPIKLVQLDTDIPILHKVKQTGLQIRPNQVYSVLEEKTDPRDKRVDKFGNPALDRKIVYVILDDNKREITVSADYFIPAEIKLAGGDEFNLPPQQTGSRLMYEDEIKDNIPDIRRR